MHTEKGNGSSLVWRHWLYSFWGSWQWHFAGEDMLEKGFFLDREHLLPHLSINLLVIHHLLIIYGKKCPSLVISIPVPLVSSAALKHMHTDNLVDLHEPGRSQSKNNHLVDTLTRSIWEASASQNKQQEQRNCMTRWTSPHSPAVDELCNPKPSTGSFRSFRTQAVLLRACSALPWCSGMWTVHHLPGVQSFCWTWLLALTLLHRGNFTLLFSKSTTGLQKYNTDDQDCCRMGMPTKQSFFVFYCCPPPTQRPIIPWRL